MNDRFIKKLWHTNRKIFLEEFSILQTIHSDGTVEHTYFEYNPKTQELERLSSCQIREIDCTGLHDKNGKLIYEGDIVNVSCGNFIIKYCDSCKSFQCFYKDDCFACEGDYHWFELLDDLENLEVIGNIYENADLLEREE